MYHVASSLWILSYEINIFTVKAIVNKDSVFIKQPFTYVDCYEKYTKWKGRQKSAFCDRTFQQG